MAYFVTGGTGFIGRFLVDRLLKERKGDIHVLVREGSEGKLKRFGRSKRIKPVRGDLGEPLLGIDPAWLQEHQGQIEHVFHLAAVYDMTASEESNERMNNGGTRHAVQVANTLEAKHLHHTSSVAAAGLYKGTFTEDMFDEGQPLDHPYHRTKFESEKIARTESTVPWRVYRPAIVLGHSQTGEMDKIDGPYYFFKALKLSSRLPDMVPFIAPRLGKTNVVPVDFVVNAMDHIAHKEGLDGRAFHLVSPKPQPTVDVLNAFAKVAGAPRFRAVLPRQALNAALKLPGSDRVLDELGIPPSTLDYADFTATFSAEKTTAALKGSGIKVPRLEDYAPVLWHYWEEHLADA
jgi:thioester reductase-like protein